MNEKNWKRMRILMKTLSQVTLVFAAIELSNVIPKAYGISSIIVILALFGSAYLLSMGDEQQ